MISNASFACATYLETDWQQLELLGSVRFIEEMFFTILHDGSGKRLDSHKNFTFSDRGYLLTNDSIVLENRSIYVYSDVNQKIRKETFDDDGQLDSQTFFEYNTSGWLVSRTTKNLEGKTELEYTFMYDDANRLVKEQHYFLGSLINTYMYAYNELGKKIEDTLLDEEGAIFCHYKYTYNDLGLVIALNPFDDSKLQEKYSYEYEFDDIGNWIKKTPFCDGVSGWLTERKISYFES